MAETTILVTNPVGLHARPAALFVKAAKQYAADIQVKNLTVASQSANAKSILGVLSIGVLQNHTIHIEAVGADAEAALTHLSNLIISNFEE